MVEFKAQTQSQISNALPPTHKCHHQHSAAILNLAPAESPLVYSFGADLHKAPNGDANKVSALAATLPAVPNPMKSKLNPSASPGDKLKFSYVIFIVVHSSLGSS